MNEISLYTESFEFETLDKNQIEKINSRLPEFHRASKIIGHSTSQTSYSLQTMNMISDSPLSRMKQCLAQINRKYMALQEAYFKIEKKKLILIESEMKTDKFSRLKVRETQSIINSMATSMESTLRQIGMFQDMYDNIRVSNGIPENWTEKDFEEQEIGNMIKSSFRIAIQDISMTGRVSKAAVEFWEQLGIHPQMGEKRVREYMVNTQEILQKNGTITIQLMYDFLDEMIKEFKDSNKLALKRMGLDCIGSERFMANGGTKPQ